MSLRPPKLTFLDTKPELGDIHSFYFSHDSKFSWKPGQFVTIILPKVKGMKASRRAFSISSAPQEDNVRITTHVPENSPSEFKQALVNLQAGDQVTVHGPHGKFTLNRGATPALLVAGGIGVTPCRSMLLGSDGGGSSKPVTLAYLARDSEFVFVPELKKAGEEDQNDVRFLTSHAELKVILDENAGSDIDYYVSGPPQMVREVAEQLGTLGAPRKRIHRDSFTGY